MAPTPESTIQVPIPTVPTETEATGWAIEHGKLIAAIIVAVLAIWFARWLFGSVQIKTVLAIVLTLVIAYMIWSK